VLALGLQELFIMMMDLELDGLIHKILKDILIFGRKNQIVLILKKMMIFKN